MTVSVRAFCLTLVLAVGPLFAAEPAPEASAPDVAAVVSEMEKVLGMSLPCPTGEAQASNEWRACIERWESLKTEELYLPYVARPTRGLASEPREADTSDAAPVHGN